MHVVQQAVDPHTPSMLVKTHGPETGDLSIRIGIQIRKCLELGLVGVHVLVRVTLGEFGSVLKRIGLDAALEFLERDHPMLDRLLGIVLLGNILFLVLLNF